ncbi:hypothetical protein ACFV85_08375 [Streptomyces niveus]
MMGISAGQELGPERFRVVSAGFQMKIISQISPTLGGDGFWAAIVRHVA